MVHEEGGAAARGMEAEKTSRKRKSLKKAPEAPRRFRSAYIIYVMAKMEALRTPDAAPIMVTETMKDLAKSWKALPPHEKQIYTQQADADKARYFEEMAFYSGPMQVPNKRAKKPLGTPKRATSAFSTFSQAHRAHVKQQYPDLKGNELAGKLTDMWRDLSEEEKKRFTDLELAERRRYQEDMRVFREKQDLAEKETSANAAVPLHMLHMQQPLMSRQHLPSPSLSDYDASFSSGDCSLLSLHQQQQRQMQQNHFTSSLMLMQQVQQQQQQHQHQHQHQHQYQQQLHTHMHQQHAAIHEEHGALVNSRPPPQESAALAALAQVACLHPPHFYLASGNIMPSFCFPPPPEFIMPNESSDSEGAK